MYRSSKESINRLYWFKKIIRTRGIGGLSDKSSSRKVHLTKQIKKNFWLGYILVSIELLWKYRCLYYKYRPKIIHDNT